LLASTAGSHESVGEWIKAQLEIVCAQLPMQDNYFWRVYIDGKYTKDCCPEYLKEENFARLKQLVGRVSIATETITEFLNKKPHHKISTFVLLDHMDWMAEKPALLSEEWNAILANATENPKFLWRSAAEDGEFVLATKVTQKGKQTVLKDILDMDTETANRLHALDRVHTYTSLHVGQLKA